MEVSNSEKNHSSNTLAKQAQIKQINIEGITSCYKEVLHKAQTERSSLLRKIHKQVLNIKYMLKPMKISGI